MTKFSKHAFYVLLALSLTTNIAMAGGLGSISSGGYKPFDRPIPDKPFDGAKQAIQDTGKAIEQTGKAVGPAIARPFEQTAQSIKDPWGWQKRTERWENDAVQTANKGIDAAAALGHQAIDVIDKQLQFAIGALTGVMLTGILAFFFRRRSGSQRKITRIPLVHPLHG
jgi:hypothetical protein